MKEIRSIRDYEMIEKIAKGGQGSIWKVKRSNCSEVFIMKRICHKKKDYAKRCIKREVLYKTYLEHKYILEIIDNFESDEVSYIIYKSYPIDLLQFLKENQSPIPSQTIQKWGFQIIQAMNHLNNHQIMHRDLKPDNILLTADSIEADIKLCDFGLIRRLDEPDSLDQSDERTISKKKNIDNQSELIKRTLTHAGTYEYAAPELRNLKKYNLKCDVWSYGVLTHVLVYRKYPKFHKGIVVFQTQDQSNYCVNDLIAKCLTAKKRERPEFSQLISHEFFNGVEDCAVVGDSIFIDIHESAAEFDVLRKKRTNEDFSYDEEQGNKKRKFVDEEIVNI